MKQLSILRHAKSDWGNEGLADIDRHLNERGYDDAYIMSKWLSENHKKPDLILCSSATRALSTALIFCRQLEIPDKRFKIESNIYEASVATLKTIIAAQDDVYGSILMVGHNPGLTDLCNDISDEQFFDNVPTCGFVSFKLDGDTWKKAIQKKASLDFYQFPKNYKEHG